jgi:hypothetical protein
MMTTLYYLPIWFQAIKEVSAVQSGIRLLPTVVAQVVASFLGAAAVQLVGQYMPFMLIGNAIMCVGTGLLTMLKLDTIGARWIGYQIPYGFGLGITLQVPLVASQTVLPLEDVPTGTSVLIFCQLLGGAIFVSVGQNLFTNELVNRIARIPGVDALNLQQEGATGILEGLSESTKRHVLVAYNASLRQAFICGLILSCIGYLGAVCMEWKSIKKYKAETGAQPTKGTASIEGKQELSSKNGHDG